MKDKEALARRLLEIECAGVASNQGHWSLEAYLCEDQSSNAGIYFWPSPQKFTAFVLYRILPFAEIWVMNWACELKGQGIGTEVFEDFLTFCSQAEFKKIGLEVRATNAAALKIYKKSGLDLVGRRENYYSNGDEALIYLGSLDKQND